MNLLVLWFSLAAVTPVDPAARCLVLPVSLPAQAPLALREAARGVEAALTLALQRNASFQTITHQDVTVQLTKAMQDQLDGCDDAACGSEIADALGADWLVTSTLDRQGGLWNLQLTLLERRTAHALKRTGVRARSLDALLGSVEEMARTLASVSSISVDDKDLQERLGTNAQGVAALREAVASTPEPDLTQAWTGVVKEHNGEREWLAAAEGTAFLGSGAAVLLASLPFLLGTVAFSWAITFAPPEGDRFAFPLLEGLSALVLPIPFLVAGAALAATGALLGVLDARDVGRLPVARNACCRNEPELRALEEPGWGRKLAPWLALGGAALAFLFPLSILIAFPAGLLLTAAGGPGPSYYERMPRVDGAQFFALYTLIELGTFAMIALLTLVPALGASVAGLVLLATQQSPLTDAAPPPTENVTSPQPTAP